MHRVHRVCRLLIVCSMLLAVVPATTAAFSLEFRYTTPSNSEPHDSVEVAISILGSIFRKETVAGPNRTISIVVPNAVNFPHGVDIFRTPRAFHNYQFGEVRVIKDGMDLGKLPMLPLNNGAAIGITGFFQ
jgi:hypothetical protein